MVRLSCLRVTYSWCRGEASSRALAQSCAGLGTAAIVNIRTAASLATGEIDRVMRRSLAATNHDLQDSLLREQTFDKCLPLVFQCRTVKRTAGARIPVVGILQRTLLAMQVGVDRHAVLRFQLV